MPDLVHLLRGWATVTELLQSPLAVLFLNLVAWLARSKLRDRCGQNSFRTRLRWPRRNRQPSTQKGDQPQTSDRIGNHRISGNECPTPQNPDLKE